MSPRKQPRGHHFARGRATVELGAASGEQPPAAVSPDHPATANIPVVKARPVNVARSAGVMAAGTLVSRMLGLLKVMLIAYALGALGPLSSIFDAANNLPNLLYLMLAGGVFNVVLVPQIIKASRLPDRGADYLSRLLTLGILVLVTLTVLFTALAGPLMTALTQFRGPQLELASQFAVWLLPQIFFYGLYALLGQILNAHDRFGAYMWAPVLNNVIAIAGVGVFFWIWGTNQNAQHTVESWDGTQTLILAGTTTLGVVLQGLVLIWPVTRLGLGLKLRWSWRGMGLGATGKIAGWALGTMVISQLSYLLITWVGTSATENGNEVAGIFVFNRASDIYILPHSIIVLSVATILFNRMARAATSKNIDALRAAVSRLVRTVGVITIFFAAVLVVLSGQIGVLLSGGRPEDAPSIGLAIAILAISSPFLSLNFMFNRVFYASEDSRTPFLLQTVLVSFGIITALLTLFFPKPVLIFALLATVSLTNFLAPVMSGIVLRRRFGDVGFASIIRSHVQFAVAAVISALGGVLVLAALGGMSILSGSVTGFAWQNPANALITMILVGLVMALIYFLSLRLMNVGELESLLRPILSRLGRFLPAPVVAFLLPSTGQADRLGSDNGEISKSSTTAAIVKAVLPEEENLANSIDIGSVIGGRYRVTEQILSSAEGDLVLEGIDQVLNRPVSIVIPTPPNAEGLTRSSREVATGDREANFQILDLSLGDGSAGTAYLITSKAPAADLLDLLVASEPFVEPYFTDALGLEIFGTARPPEPAPGPYDYVYEDNTPLATSPSESSATSGKESTQPKVTLWDEPVTDPDTIDDPELVEHDPTSQTPVTATPSVSLTSPVSPVSPVSSTGAASSKVTASASPAAMGASATTRPAPAAAEPEFNEDDENRPRSGRWLVMTILIAILGIALVLALSQIGNLFSSGPTTSTSTSAAPSPSEENSTAPAVSPVPVGVTRVISGGDPTLSNDQDSNLGNLIDSDSGTSWRSVQFASANFGRLAQGLALVIELQEPAPVSSVTITQVGGTGGSFDLLANNQPSLEGARNIGTGSFTGPEITVVPSGSNQGGQDNRMQYLIINFRELPRLQSSPLPNLPYGLRISEIGIQ
ncbi:murein biosynthesis integral membrane protein MurJ [Acaricomes phytoseiuli]|uniref:murein biosynthesis integral membrane protein MurJ n=1 Tax=Acaricomes phytoseiuli TaxID=291968 RepID=UPI0022222793|nr:murein biosynthesis integral membrane protein MurJ [Acaricomes phytoseiuli]MCW1248648.1 murein biosynthesis integral membrane protein MurJ [Acaricomes phytoseiuli]